MRIAHVITRLIVGGAQENTLHTVEDQARLFGDEVTLMTGPGIGPEGSLEERARRNGVDLRIIPASRRNLHPWYDWQTYRALVRELKAYRPQVVHTHSSKAGILGRLIAHQLRLPCVHTIHGASFHIGQSSLAFGLYRRLERWVGPWTDHFISVADAMTEQYVAAGVAPREKFTTVYSGFDVGPFLQPPRPREEVRRELGLQPDDVVFAKVARLFPLKGHPALLAVAAAVVRAEPRVKFLLIGDGVMRAQYEQQVAAMGLSQHFVLTGLVPPTRIPELLHAADGVVHTSEWEGLARVLPQGLIAGKPVVSFDVDGAREVVVTGETGVLVPRGDLVGLTEALRELAANPEKRAAYGAMGRERFQHVFRHEVMTERIREVYARVLAARPM